jgi:hypothetical protein
MTTSRLTIISRLYALCGVTLLLTLGGCSASTVNQAPVHRPGPDLRGYYGTRTPAELAYGGPTGIKHQRASERPDLDAYLKPSALDKAKPVLARNDVARTKAPVQRTAAIPAPAPVQEQALVADAKPAPIAPASLSAPADAQRYAAREGQSSKQQQYRGGDAVVISVSTLLVILLIVILILLLT